MQHDIDPYIHTPIGSYFARGNIANVANRRRGVSDTAAQQGERNNAEHKEPWTDPARTLHGHIGNQGGQQVL